MSTNVWSSCPLGPKKVDFQKEPKKFTTDVRNWMCEKIKEGFLDYEILHQRFNIPNDTLRRWNFKYRRNGTCRAEMGRPSFLSQDSLEEVKQYLQGNEYSIRDREFKDKVKQLHIKELSKIEDVNEALVSTPSRRTMGRIDRAIGARIAVAEVTTNARAEACADIRNFVSFAAAAFLMRFVSRYLTFNADCTQFHITGAGTAKETVHYIPEEDENGKVKRAHHQVVPKKGESQDLTSFFVKWFAIVNAGGQSGTPVFIVSDPGMKDGDFQPYLVDGLGYKPGANEKWQGWLVFSKTRCPPPAFYRWFFKNILIEFAKSCKASFQIDEEHDQVWMTLDGEMIQIEGFLFDDETIS